MSREIKFRAWHKELKVMLGEEIALYTDTIGLSDDAFESEIKPYGYTKDYEEIYKDDELFCTVLDGDEWVFIEKEKVDLMQFTGLKDKNDEEIYEGDIIKTPEGNIIEIFFGEKIYKFGRDIIECNGWLARKVNSTHVETLDTSMTTGEVIGNIYENKNLLQ
jgi:uncharacterized phage protein (TIGR01671 family)